MGLIRGSFMLERGHGLRPGVREGSLAPHRGPRHVQKARLFLSSSGVLAPFR